jgi:hypothetical protein
MAYRTLAERQERLVGRSFGAGSSESLDRLVSEGRRLQEILDRATPPEVMAEATIAPARAPMGLEPEYQVDAQGFRRVVGKHFREASVLELVCLRAYERHKAKPGGGEFVAPFSFHQIAIAGDYRELVRWREGAPMRCSSFEGGRSGSGGSGLFIETFIEQGRALEILRQRIGSGVAIEAGQEGRLAGRRDILDRELIDRVVLHDMQIPAVLRGFGWSDGGRVKARAQEALRRILDRMLGRDPEIKGD